MPTDPATLTAADLLAIPDTDPVRLFGGSAAAVKQSWRLLAMRWHPDRNADPLARAVFQHVGRLFDAAQGMIARGTWPGRGTLALTAVDGKSYEIACLRRHPFELGTMAVARTVVAFVVDRDHADLVVRARATIAAFAYADDRMRGEVARCLPAFPFAGAFRTADAEVVVMRKAPDLLLLRDVLDHFNGRMDARHVAWVVSSLLNLCCYFQYAGIVHNALSLDTCFVSPRDHGVAVLGGWWYAARAGAPMAAAPAATVEWGPHDLMRTRRAGIRTDLELVRAIGRALLGDVGGMRLARDGTAPRPMVDWLRLPAPDDPIDDYRTWRNRVLQDSFGARRFAELPLTQSDIYR